MNEYLIEVINFVPSYYPFETKDRAIGLANFYAQKPTQNYRKLHDDIVYRRFIQTCDVVGVPIGPCNKLLKGNLIPCVRGGGGGGATPFPVCRGEALDLPCGCECPGSCLNDPGLSTTADYIENIDRDSLLQYIDGAANFPDSVPGGSTITNELAGNGLWIGLPPSCYGVWIALSDCETGSFSGFYHFDSPKIQNEIVFGVDDSVTLRGRGQRIKVAIDDPNSSEPRYERYQVYYAYEFAYQLGLQPPNDMTFKLAGDNLIELAENDYIANTDEGGIAEGGVQFEASSDPYSRFCSSIFYPVQTRGCIKTTEKTGGLGDKPCVCDDPYEQELPPIGEETPLSTRKYIRKNDVPDDYKNAGIFSLDDGSTTACENIAFERANADPDDGVAEIPILEEDQYYDAFSRAVITWNQNANWEDEQDGFATWFSWTRVNVPVIIWNDEQVHDNCYQCLLKKKENGVNDPGVPPCENIPCGRIEINAEPQGDVFDAWAGLDTSSNYDQGGLAGDGSAGITRSQAAEWDFFAKFGFPTFEKYSLDLDTNETNESWYNEIKSRFIEITQDDGVAFETYTFVREANQYSIPCFPRTPCELGETRITQILDFIQPCDVGYTGETHKLFIGGDISFDACRECSKCYPPDCCVDPYERFELGSSPIPLAHYYSINTISDSDFDVDNPERYKNYSKQFEKNTSNNLECYVRKCSAKELEDAYQTCIYQFDNPTFEQLNDCMEQVAEECLQEIDQFILPYSNYKCNNNLDSLVITRLYDTEVWVLGTDENGIPLSDCGFSGLSSLLKCVYETTPLRPSSKHWRDINYGQCYKITETPVGDGSNCILYEPEWSFPRTEPYFTGTTGGGGCPGNFECNVCEEGKYSQCTCCSAFNFLDENTKRQTRSVSYECDDENCPKCCSMCLENPNGIHDCDDVYLQKNIYCPINDCILIGHDIEDCLVLTQNPKDAVTLCPGDDPYGCDNLAKQRDELDCGSSNDGSDNGNSGGPGGGLGS